MTDLSKRSLLALAAVAAVAGLTAKSGNERFAWDSYRRFIQMYSDVVLGLDHDARLHVDVELFVRPAQDGPPIMCAIPKSPISGRPRPE